MTLPAWVGGNYVFQWGLKPSGDFPFQKLSNSIRFPQSRLLKDRCNCQLSPAKSLQLCLTLCNPMDCSPPGSSVHGILQARILEWVAMPSSRGSSKPRDQNCVSCIPCIGRQVLYCQCHLASPKYALPKNKCKIILCEEIFKIHDEG